MQYKFPSIEEKAPGDQAINDLGRQLQKYVQRWNQGSIATRYRYADACSRWVKFAGRGQPGQPGLQKLTNMNDKHLVKYADYLKNQEKSDKYIKNEMSALRYLHINLPNARHELSDAKKINAQAGLGATPNNRATLKNQAWTQAELDKYVDYAVHDPYNKYPKLGNMMENTRETGCRLEEISTLRSNQVAKALRTSQLHLVNTKGGRPRGIPLSDEARRLFAEAIRDVPRGEYIYVPEGTPVHKFIADVKNYIYKNRDKVQDPSRAGDPSRAELHWHGIRHMYAQSKYAELRDQGKSDYEARSVVAQLLGHNRIDVTRVYIP